MPTEKRVPSGSSTSSAPIRPLCRPCPGSWPSTRASEVWKRLTFNSVLDRPAVYFDPGWRSMAHTLGDAGPRERRLPASQDRVSPESTMSSTMSTCRPVMSVSRSLRIRTTPEDLVPEP